MAQTTVELRTLIERTNFKLFDFDYQFDDPVMKAKLEQEIIDYYYDYEIGFETPDMFKRKFKTRFLRMIGYYNQLHNTTLLDYNPLSNYSMTEAMEQLSKTTTASDSTIDNITDSTNDTHNFTDSNTKNSDYPQQPIAGGDFLNGESNTISDSTTDSKGKITDKGTTTTTEEGTTNTDYSKTIEGITGTSYPELIQKHRDSLIRISNQVIEELKPCFILVY